MHWNSKFKYLKWAIDLARFFNLKIKIVEKKDNLL
jgi:hypothetical protein